MIRYVLISSQTLQNSTYMKYLPVIILAHNQIFLMFKPLKFAHLTETLSAYKATNIKVEYNLLLS